MPAVYQSKIDTWLFVVLGIATVSSLGASILIIFCAPVSTWWALPIDLFLGIGLSFWFLASTRHIL